MKKIKILFVIIIALSILNGCYFSNNKDNVQKINIEKRTDKIVNYGNGIYYFPYIYSELGNTLSAFIEAHPELELVDIEYSHKETGYYVIFKKR